MKLLGLGLGRVRLVLLGLSEVRSGFLELPCCWFLLTVRLTVLKMNSEGCVMQVMIELT